MLSEGWSNEVLSARGEGDDPHAAVFDTLDAADQAFREETVHGNADRTWGEIHDGAYRIDGQRPLVQQHFQHPEIRVAKSSSFNSRRCVARQRAHCLQHDKPNMRRLLNTVGHKIPESS